MQAREQLLTNADIQIINDRNHDKNWLELNDILTQLPYPVALPLRKYIAAIDKEKAAHNARDAFEALLAFAAYTSFAELISHNISYLSILKNFAHRSMGPLKALLEHSLGLLGDKAEYSREYKKIFTHHNEVITKAIDDFTNHKHKKLKASDFDINTPLKVLANICKQAMLGKSFVYCEDGQKISRIKHTSILREAVDNPPFINHKQYICATALAINETYILSYKNNEVLPLTPLIFVKDDEEAHESKRFFIFDKKDSKLEKYTAKAIDSDYCDTYESLSNDILELLQAIYNGNGAKIIEKMQLSEE